MSDGMNISLRNATLSEIKDMASEIGKIPASQWKQTSSEHRNDLIIARNFLRAVVFNCGEKIERT